MTAKKKISALGYALLGVLHQEARSGYDLRKLFATTPLKSFSDSPGSIYPALERLERGKLIKGKVEERSGMRRRKLYTVTDAGLEELRVWQARPVTREDIQSAKDEVLLRFSFNDQLRPEEDGMEFLTAFEAQVKAYTVELKEFHKLAAPAMSMSGKLALESGIHQYESLLAWARSGIRSYEQQSKKESRV